MTEELDIGPMFTATTRIRRVKRQDGETACDEPITFPEKKIEVEFFNCFLDTALISVNERFEQLNEYSESWSFLYNIKKIPEEPDLLKFCGDFQLILTVGSQSNIDGSMLCDELLSQIFFAWSECDYYCFCFKFYHRSQLKRAVSKCMDSIANIIDYYCNGC